MESLHRQVLPFLLRRLKEDVLQDLPPKILQDYYCDLSPLQMQLYEDFAKSRARKSLEDSVQGSPDKQGASPPGTSHIFQVGNGWGEKCELFKIRKISSGCPMPWHSPNPWYCANPKMTNDNKSKL